MKVYRPHSAAGFEWVLVVDPDDPAAVGAALQRLLGDQLLARRLGQGGRKAIETYYNWDRVIRDLRDIESQVSS